MNRFYKFLCHPILNGVGFIIGIIGIFLAIYFYFLAKEDRQLSYYVAPVKTTIIKKGEDSSLFQVTYNNERIEGDVTATQLAIWNNGQMAIKKQDVLKPIIIHTVNNARFLEAKMLSISRDVTGIKLNNAGKQIGITWDILEKNDGGVFQLIYVGNANEEIKLGGIVEKQGEPSEFKYRGKKLSSPLEQYYAEMKDSKIAPFGIGGTGALFLIIYFLIRIIKKKSSIFFLVFGVLYLLFGIAIYIFYSYQTPKFNFSEDQSYLQSKK